MIVNSKKIKFFHGFLFDLEKLTDALIKLFKLIPL